MIHRALLVILATLSLSTSYAQEAVATRQRPARRGENAGCGSRDATILSMMGWGLGLGVGIATLCALIPDNLGGSSSSHAHTSD